MNTKKMPQLATVTSGKYKGKLICVLAHFEDSNCVCEFPMKKNKSGKIKIIKRKKLRFWVSVQKAGKELDARQ